MKHSIQTSGSLARSCLGVLALVATTALAQQDPPPPAFANVAVHDPSVLRAGS
ncbi:MAG: hypothetical protein QG602_347, partial [Verrucomicrobiota bacterium]|nr:hypothetical protein [Verrucomicrobiota bacterium]